jgi:pimeloyl-ACP methyl ester carboxylesterase
MTQTESDTFDTGAGRCAVWVTAPTGPGPHPAVLLIHGLGATHEMALLNYERWFSEAGMVVVSFDYRFNGASPGTPRQVIRVKNLLADVDAALDFTLALPAVDPTRVALWGTSFGASHAMTIAARRQDVAAVVLNCPMIDGRNAALRLGARHIARLFWPITSDLIRSAIHPVGTIAPRYVPIVAEPGDFALIDTPGAKQGWYSLLPPDTNWDNRCTAAIAVDLLGYRAVRAARLIRCPMLVCVSDNENLMDPAISVQAAQTAPRGRAVHYPADHFQVYHPPLVDRMIADQLTFLREALAIAVSQSTSQPIAAPHE